MAIFLVGGCADTPPLATQAELVDRYGEVAVSCEGGVPANHIEAIRFRGYSAMVPRGSDFDVFSNSLVSNTEDRIPVFLWHEATGCGTLFSMHRLQFATVEEMERTESTQPPFVWPDYQSKEFADYLPLPEAKRGTEVIVELQYATQQATMARWDLGQLVLFVDGKPVKGTLYDKYDPPESSRPLPIVELGH